MFTVFNEELDRAARQIRDRHLAFAHGKWNDTDLTAYQLDAFKATLAYVKEHSAFYGRHLAGVAESAFTSLDPQRLATVPFTTKDDLRREFENILLLPLSKAWIFYETTGTTGRSTPCPRTNIDSLNNNTALTVYYDTVFRQFGDEQVIGVSGPTEMHAFGDTFGEVCRNLGHAVVKMWPHSPMVGYQRALEALRTLPATGLSAPPGWRCRWPRRHTPRVSTWTPGCRSRARSCSTPRTTASPSPPATRCPPARGSPPIRRRWR